MLRSLKDLGGYDLEAQDGDIGAVSDFYFDDFLWIVRYLVADTRKWLPGKKVLLSPVSLGSADWEHRSMPVHLTKEQIEKSPEVDKDKPVSEQHQPVCKYYGWDMAWCEDDPDLRSLREVIGYTINAEDGEIGVIDDLITEDDSWRIRHIVVDTHKWLPGRRVLISPDWIKRIDAEDKGINVDLLREQVRDAPEFDPNTAVNREYEEVLYDYYGRPKYWVQVSNPDKM